MSAFIGAGLAGVLVLGLLLVVGGGDDEAADIEVFFEPVASITPDPFTDSVAVTTSTTVPAAAPAASSTVPAPEGAVSANAVDGSEPGLYGGTRQRGECDPGKLVAFLEANPDKAAAWAAVQGIEPSGIASFVDGLTSVVLRRDTLVTNHGYRNGKATARQAVLQAGTAVLVDAFGVPRAKCECGNPLAEPEDQSSHPRYRGSAWTGFSPGGVVEVKAERRVEVLVLVDAATQGRFTRPVGSTGSGDGDLSTETCDLYPKDAACGGGASTTTSTAALETTTSSAVVPTGEPVELFTVYSLLGTQEGPTVPSVFTLEDDTYITMIQTYHYGATGTPGTIALESSDGKTYGPWTATGAPGQGGVDNAYWQAPVNEVGPAGEYPIGDSDPATWSIAPDTGGRGICWVFGYPPEGGSPR